MISGRYLLPLIPLIGIALALALYSDLLLEQTGHAQDRVRCFDETGFCLRGTFLDYWERNGAERVFGYPISDVQLATSEDTWTGQVQWFERERLEDHGLSGMMRGRLGADLLNLRGENWQLQAHQGAIPDGCEYVVQTRQVLCEPLLSYWRNNGGLDRFGWPLTALREETIEGWTGNVQYFERARLELHPEAPTTAQIQIGRIGSAIFETYGTPGTCPVAIHPDLYDSYERLPFRSKLGCPQEVEDIASSISQPFERGQMVGFSSSTGNYIYAYTTLPTLSQRRYLDTWRAGEPVVQTLQPPSGYLAPQVNLGKAWYADPELLSLIGWGTQPARISRATVQRFDYGWLLWEHDTSMIYAFGAAADAVAAFQRPTLLADTGALAGVPAPRLGGDLVAQTASVDFYRLPGGLSAADIRTLSSAVEEAIASGATMLGTSLHGRMAIQFEPAQTGPCAIRGLTLSGERTIRMFYEPGFDLRRIQVILAHEIIHQLQHDYYGASAHLQSDVILLEGMAVWASNPYYRDTTNRPYYHTTVEAKRDTNRMLPLTLSLEADCRTTTRVSIYDQWASFTEYLLIRYGRERFDAVYSDSRGRPAGSANYTGVYGKSLTELEAEWLTWLSTY